jgi:hypothetical protein
MSLRHLALFLLIPASTAVAQSHCHKGEIDYFSCVTDAAGKAISVCGNVPEGTVEEDAWLQYRFGKLGAIEFTYPAIKDHSVPKFEGNSFWRINLAELRFINGSVLYAVNLYGPYDGEDAAPRKGYSGGVDVSFRERADVRIHCTKVSGEKYFRRFDRVNVLLQQYNGESNFLGRFQQQRTPK